MNIGDKVKLKNNSNNTKTYKEYTNCIGTVIDKQTTIGREKQYFRVSFGEQGAYGPYIDIGSWRVEKVS